MRLFGSLSANRLVGGSISMSAKLSEKIGSSMFMLSARKGIKKYPKMHEKPEGSLTKYEQGKVLSRASSSPLASLYRTEEFRNEWANDIKFHVARNIFYLRKYREQSQAEVAAAMKTSQSAIARMENAQENMTLDTLQRLTVALRGVFRVSITPQEFPAGQASPWWESVATCSQNSEWKMVRAFARSTSTTDQVIAGFERTRSRKLFVASGETYSKGGILDGKN
jgi:transcriptional regulator with XRE-family HTH domain